MKLGTAPALWLVIFIAMLPSLSETIYMPSLPDIARDLRAEESLVEYTLTIFLFGFALGTLFWGKYSDAKGRKPCIIAGYLLFIIGCFGCYLSSSIEMLMASRLVQAFGGSVGSVLGQALCRDAFEGKELARAYSIVGATVFCTPAVGPVVGGIIDQNYGWSPLFLLLMVLGAIVTMLTYKFLIETHHPHQDSRKSMKEIAYRLVQDKPVIGFAIVVAACNGISFSYYGEGSFYMIDLLGLSSSLFGATFIGFALAGFSGGYVSKKMQTYTSSLNVMALGIKFSLAGTIGFLSTILLLSLLQSTSSIIALLTMLCMMVINFGAGLITPNALSIALKDYRDAIGTASSLFGCFYYVLISLFTLGMGALHNNTLLVMPLYFCGCALILYVTYKKMIQEQKVQIAA